MTFGAYILVGIQCWRRRCDAKQVQRYVHATFQAGIYIPSLTAVSKIWPLESSDSDWISSLNFVEIT